MVSGLFIFSDLAVPAGFPLIFPSNEKRDRAPKGAVSCFLVSNLDHLPGVVQE